MTTDSRSQAVVARLVASGLLDPAHRPEAEAVVAQTLGDAPGAAAPLRRRMAEIAGYVGGAFVVGAAVLFFGATWDDLTTAVQTGLLLGSAALLVATGLGVSATGGGRAVLGRPDEAVRRRLVSVLLTAAAGCAAFGTAVWLDDRTPDGELAIMLAALVGVVVCAVGYLLAPTTVGQLGVAAAGFVMIPTGLSALPGESTSAIAFGLAVLALGVAWLALAELGAWREVLSARVIGCVLSVVGAQIPMADTHAWVAYAATAGVGAAAFWLYAVRRAWPYLATGVVAVTLAVPEALSDWADGSLGAAGLLLVAGVTLLVAALLGLRLRRQAVDG